MQVRCKECATRYQIPDEKIRGRKVRMPCRRCGAAIVIDARGAQGDKPDWPGASEPPPLAVGAPVDAAGVGAGPEELWSISAGGAQRKLTVRQIAAEYRVGSIPRTAYVWRAGMTDWVLLPDAKVLRQGLAVLGLDLDETEMSMAKLADTAVASGPTSSIPPPLSDTPEAPTAGGGGGSSAAADERSSPSAGRIQVAAPAPPPTPAPRPESAAEGPSIVIDDTAAASPPPPRPRPMPRMSANPTVKLQRPPGLPRPRKSRAPVGAIVMIVIIAVVAGAAGHWLSRTYGAARRPSPPTAVPSGSDRPAAVVSVAPPSPAAPTPSASSRAAGASSTLDHASAERAMEAAAREAERRCRRQGEPRGSAVVLVSFLPSGRTAGVSLEGELSGTSTGLCVLRSFHGATVSPFDGEPVAMKRDVHVR